MTESIVYRFHDKDAGPDIRVELTFDDATYRMVLPPDAPQPDWARLEFEKCPNCPLGKTVAYCPAALAVAHFLPKFAAHISHNKAVVEVDTPNRVVISKTTLQKGMASLMGLAMATSGCPRTVFLRPMARFHLPFADERETVFRSLGAWLVVNYIHGRVTGKSSAPSLEGLKRAYAELQSVNAAFAERLRAAVTRDAALNAIVILDTFAMIAPENIDGGFEEVKSALVVEDAG